MSAVCQSFAHCCHLSSSARRVYADEELRQRMRSDTDEYCEAVESLLEMHQSRLSDYLTTQSPTADSSDNSVSTLHVNVSCTASST